ncbi:hypothetical protein VEHSUH05_04760 [Veillonella denticariosi JCM 15641]|uniref:Uncharacterized protein n=1 Tax=Veillonella denticariosi JCM 15641 TaxID=1298594 RepID=A0A2S7ZAZ3_9FIRM|nr:hypothetical protein [Veillonella denticariosi]PQL20379.1 hypothetical protein VEHSUH05_04760 [Veillonella denticariosi JCM 15641]
MVIIMWIIVIILLLYIIIPKLNRYLYLRKNPRIKASILAEKLYNSLYFEEKERSENFKDYVFNTDNINLQFAIVLYRVEDKAIEVIDMLKDMNGEYLIQLLELEPNPYGKVIEYPENILIKAKLSMVEYTPQLILAKWLEDNFGRKEAAKYAYDLITNYPY